MKTNTAVTGLLPDAADAPSAPRVLLSIRIARIVALCAVTALGLASRGLAQGTWQSLPSMPGASYSLGAEFVNGKLYAISGFATNRTAIYDPAANAWATGAPLPSIPGKYNLLQSYGHAVIGNTIYIVGGDTGGSGWVATLFGYDTLLNSWSQLPSMPGGARYGLVAGSINGKLYAVGGWNGSAYVATNECFDPVTNTWTTKAPVPVPLGGSAAAVINGRLYVVCAGDNAGPITPVFIYNPQTDLWTTGANGPSVSGGGAAVVDGKIFVPVGSYADYGSVAVYNSATDSWSSETPRPTIRGAFAVAGDPNARKVYVVGGYYPPSGTLATLEALTPASTALQGPPGPQGPAGPQGPQGPAGAVGAPGPKGDTGDSGAMGPQGLKGDPGAIGAAGPQGAQGPAGAAGPQGAKGDTGAVGPVGPQGPAGAHGATGATGAVGPQGIQGPVGPVGPQGLIGPGLISGSFLYLADGVAAPSGYKYVGSYAVELKSSGPDDGREHAANPPERDHGSNVHLSVNVYQKL